MSCLIIKLDATKFKEEIAKDTPILVDFWASWCGPCMLQSEILEDLATLREDLRIGKVNTDEQMSLALEYGINAIPVLLMFKSGEEVERFVGLTQAEDIIALFARHGA